MRPTCHDARSRASQRLRRRARGARPLLLTLVAAAALAPAPAVAATSALPGSYARTQDGQRFTLRLAADGVHTFRVDGDLAARGTYTRARGHRITFRAERGPLACRGAGTYRWRLRGERLSFDLVRDRCGGRRAVLTRGAFTKR